MTPDRPPSLAAAIVGGGFFLLCAMGLLLGIFERLTR